MIDKKYLLVSLGIIPLVIIINSAYAQLTPIDRILIDEKYFELCPDDFLSSNTYNDGNRISYNITGCPISTIVINNWNNISLIQQEEILTKLSGLGYKEKVIPEEIICPDNIVDDGTGNLIAIDENGQKTRDAEINECGLEQRHNPR